MQTCEMMGFAARLGARLSAHASRKRQHVLIRDGDWLLFGTFGYLGPTPGQAIQNDSPHSN